MLRNAAFLTIDPTPAPSDELNVRIFRSLLTAATMPVMGHALPPPM